MKNWITGQQARLKEQDALHYQHLAILLKQPYLELDNNGYSINILKLMEELTADQKKELIVQLSYAIK